SSLIRLREDTSHTFSTLDVNVGGNWLPFIKLDGVIHGNPVPVVLDSSQPNGVQIFAPFGNDLGSRGAAWRVAGVGDFDADGTSDILWQNTTTGGLDDWKMLNGNWAKSTQLGSRGPDWAVAGVGDFNGDGTADILWRNKVTGQLDDWQMASGNWSRSVDLGSRSTDSQIAGIADLNGDGTDDILW